MKKIFLLLLALFFLSSTMCQAHLLRGYDLLRQSSTCTAVLNVRDNGALKTIYLQKIFEPNAAQYRLSAYNEKYQSILDENVRLQLVPDETSLPQLSSQKETREIRLHPFYRPECSRIDASLPHVLIEKIRTANALTLLFLRDKETLYTISLPEKALNEWKKLIDMDN